MIFKLKCLLYTASVFWCINSYAQQTVYQGFVINAQSGAPIPNITISLVLDKTAIAAGEKGEFTLLPKQDIATDTLRFSGVGFITKKIAINAFVNKSKVSLLEDAVFLNEVKVSSKRRKLKRKTLNPYIPEQHKLILKDFLQMYQAAMKFTMPETFGKLKSLSLNRFTRPQNFTNKHARFRIHVYDVDEMTGGPGDEIVHQVIEVTDEGSRTITIDMEPYDVSIPGKQFFAGIEWLFLPENEDIARGIINTYHIKYEPTISNMLPTNGIVDTWIKEIPGAEWKNHDPVKNDNWYVNIAISAVVEN